MCCKEGWYNGNGAPNDHAGESGEYYLDDLTGDVYQKANFHWHKVANIKGEKGDQGIQGPKGDTGEQGPPGEQGQPGASGAVYASQYVNLNVIAPFSKVLSIPDCPDLKRVLPGVLKFVPGDQITTVENNFDNGEKSAFNAPDSVIFDGLMYQQTVFTFPVSAPVALTDGSVYSFQFVKSDYKHVEKVEVL